MKTMKRYLFFTIMVSFNMFSQNGVQIKILDSLVYGETTFNVSILNNSNESYLFLMDNLYQGLTKELPSGMLEYAYPVMLLEHYNEENELPRTTVSYSGQWIDNDDYSYIDITYNFKEQLKPKGKGFVFLKPNESFNFTMSLSLIEENRYFHKVDFNKDYLLFLRFRPHLYRSERYIPKETVEFVKEHNILVFEGELISNKVRVSFKEQ